MKSRLANIAQDLLARGQQPLMPVAIWGRELDGQIRTLDWHGHEGETAVIALMAGLHLRNDNLLPSHSFAQLIESDATGACWHGIMHRMEGDFSNAKYWFYQAGKHPVLAIVAQEIAAALQGSIDIDPERVPQGRIRSLLLDFRDRLAWTPSAFTDLVQWQQGRELDPALLRALEQMQSIETSLLLKHSLAMCEPVLNSIADAAHGHG